MTIHNSLTNDDLHVPWRIFADDTARLAYTPTVDDAGKLFYVKTPDAHRAWIVDDALNWLEWRSISYGAGLTYEVADLADLPPASAGVITIPSGTSWRLCNAVDLLGARIVCEGAVSFSGSSPETCTITSTGLSGAAIINSIYSVTLRNIAIITPAGCEGVNLDGSGGGAPIAVDWFGVNFTGTGRSAVFRDVDNAIMILMGWLGSDGILVNGTINTLAVSESIFSMFSSGQKAIAFGVGGVVNRRLRIESSAAIIGSGATGFDVADANIANVEGYIIYRCNLSGAGTRTSGITYLNDKVRWSENRGVINSARVGALGWTDNATVTPITLNVPSKALATSTANPINQRFSHSNNRLTYTSEIAGTFYVSATASLISGNNLQCSVFIYKNGLALEGGVSNITTNGSGRAESVAVQALVELSLGDYLEIWVSNRTNSTNITVSAATQIVRAL